MRARLGVARAEAKSAEAIAAYSCSALDRPLRYDAELCVAVSRDEALLAGAFQRRSDLVVVGQPHKADAFAVRPSPPTKRLRRGSGGPGVRVGEGTIHVALSLTHPGALVACDERHIVNRLVRPLLRALTKTGNPAHFFGRDWVSVAHSRGRAPAGWVGFAHDATTQRTTFEAFVAVRTPYSLGAHESRGAKAQGTLESLAGHPVDAMRIAEAIAQAYGAYAVDAETIFGIPPESTPWAVGASEAAFSSVPADDWDTDPPWAATCMEAIGTVGAGPDARGIFRVGGDLLVSRDALARLERRAAGSRDEDIGAVVSETLGAPGVALDGVKSLVNVRDVIVSARRASHAGHP